MNKDTSTYLDCTRFLAASAVMVGHVNGFLASGTLPFFINHLAMEAVGVFFVLSGFVIGYVTDVKEKDLKTYGINRAARLYSVVVPCLIITFLIDAFGRHFLPSSFSPADSNAREALHILFSLTFLDQAWILPHAISPGSDGPFWSLCFEVSYYLIFGAALFLRGLWRWLIPVALCLCAGPNIVVLFPLWLAGLLTYRLCRGLTLPRHFGRGLLALSCLFWAGFEAYLWHYRICNSLQGIIDASNILLYGAGLIFALSIIGFSFAAISVRRFSAPISWLAGASFTLYLLQFPFACLLSNALPPAWPPFWRFAILIAASYAAAFFIAEFTERRKHVWRRNIERLVDAGERIFFILKSRLRPAALTK